MLKEKFPGTSVYKGVNPRQAVVMGAAILAAKIKGLYPELQDLTIRDVCPLTIGVSVRRGIMLPLIRRSTRLPVSGMTQSLVTVYNDQEVMPLNIFEGEYKMTKNNNLLGGCRVSGIPKGVVGSQKVTLRFGVTEDGILTISATKAWNDDLAIDVPIEKNPWLYTKEQLLELVAIDPEMRRQDDIEADQTDRSFARDTSMYNIESYIRNAERDGTEFALNTTSEDRRVMVEAARRLPEIPSWAELDTLRTLFNTKFKDFVAAHPQEFSRFFWVR
jgi:molecular chaperone DnaK (HSP70)